MKIKIKPIRTKKELTKLISFISKNSKDELSPFCRNLSDFDLFGVYSLFYGSLMSWGLVLSQNTLIIDRRFKANRDSWVTRLILQYGV